MYLYWDNENCKSTGEWDVDVFPFNGTSWGADKKPGEWWESNPFFQTSIRTTLYSQTHYYSKYIET